VKEEKFKQIYQKELNLMVGLTRGLDVKVSFETEGSYENLGVELEAEIAGESQKVIMHDLLTST
jgi:hypothetical protein